MLQRGHQHGKGQPTMRRRLALLALLHTTTAQDHPCDLTPATVARINDWILNGNDPGNNAFELCIARPSQPWARPSAASAAAPPARC